jgi:hypothetical protein
MKRPCPALKDFRIDWLPPATPGGKDRVQIEVKQADGSYKSKGERESDFKHSEVDWSSLVITQVSEQNPDNPENPWT